MQSTVLVSAFAEIAREKDIDRDTLQVIVEDVFRTLIKKRYGADDPEAFEIIFNPDNGDYQIIHIREVVEDYDLEDPVSEIEFSDALEIDEDYEVGDQVAESIQINDFGRRAVQMALQTFRQKIRDIEKENIHRDYSELINEIVVGEIYQTRRREVLVIHNKVELVLKKEGQIYKDRYRKGDMIRAVVTEVERDAGANPQVVISRTAPVFIERLFELEVPEIYDGIVEIKKVVREPGDRAKVAVVSHDDRVDPVGACVGVKGSRIHAVVRELGNENIDVIPWTTDPIEFIKRALAPANPIAVELNDNLTPPRARVTVPADEVSMAIGRGGQNIRLASKLTGYELDVYRDIRDDEEDVEITEFGDAIPMEMIEKLKNIGCDTAKAVLELSAEELARRTELPIETTEKIILLMKAEFEDESVEEAGEEEVVDTATPEVKNEPETPEVTEEPVEVVAEAATEINENADSDIPQEQSEAVDEESAKA
ncbi:MAG: transcription termination factor NusA [Rubricoccaceae bacterium]|nr:transcription termination factor NusA [Rubricoccaceae bacterium]